MNHAVVVAAVLLGAGAAAAQPAAICEEVLADLSGACPCLIDGAADLGIDEAALSGLLRDAPATVPLETFRAYGALYVGCIAEAAATRPAPPPAAPEADATLQIAPVATLAPGTWATVAVRTPWGGFAGPGTVADDGAAMLLACTPSQGASGLFVDGLAAAATVTVTARRGSGAVLFDAALPMQRVAGGLQVLPLGGDLVRAIRLGATVEVVPEGSPGAAFGLGGSNAAIGPGVCGRDGRFVDTAGLALAGDWTADGDGAAFDARAPFAPPVSVGCDGALRLGGETPLTAVDLGFDIYLPAAAGRLAFVERAAPLSAEALTALLDRPTLALTFDAEAPASGRAVVALTLEGFAAAFADACPD